ncbi:MAG: hypothetical protein HC914_11445 [Chloroflexaceae bacterium]|nr:hypothetical protein [Chloroflexaceae bacterium]
MAIGIPSTAHVLDKAAAGERLYYDEMVHLAQTADLTQLSEAATVARQRHNPGQHITYLRRHATVQAIPINHAPATLGDGLALIDWLHRNYSPLAADCLRPTDLLRFAAHTPLRDVLRQLAAAGLRLVPGDEPDLLRLPACNSHCYTPCADQPVTAWFRVMREALKAGLDTTAAAVVTETTAPEDYVRHLHRIRILQDYALRTHGSGFLAFSVIPEQMSPIAHMRAVALARIFLDNIPYHQVRSVHHNPALLASAFSFGVDDVGAIGITTLYDPSTPAAWATLETQVQQTIRAAGLFPARRDYAYNILNTLETDTYNELSAPISSQDYPVRLSLQEQQREPVLFQACLN